jgi:hypothetical protein
LRYVLSASGIRKELVSFLTAGVESCRIGARATWACTVVRKSERAIRGIILFICRVKKIKVVNFCRNP